MGDGCVDCQRWEEDLYWSRFKTVQFCQILSGNFHQRLAIPKKFTNEVRDKLCGTVTLKGPSGDLWKVGLTTNGDTSVLQQGWKEFVKAYFLEENDILIFKYNENSRFEVSMFDRSSLCEKEASFFVKKCQHTVVESGRNRKRNTPSITENDVELVDDQSTDDAVEYRPKRTPRNEAAKTLASSRHTTPQRGSKKVRGGSTSGKYGNQLQLTSRRRVVTEEEKEMAKQNAMEQAASLPNSFVLVMQPSYVYRGFYMSIPAEWSKKNLPSGTQDIVLRMKEKTWHARYFPTAERNFTGRLVSGWKKFVLDNFLEECDVCLFNPADGTDDGIILDVSIFRVVEEVVPPVQVSPTSQSHGKRGRPPNSSYGEGKGSYK